MFDHSGQTCRFRVAGAALLGFAGLVLAGAWLPAVPASAAPAPALTANLFPIPTTASYPAGIAAGNGTVWFTESAGNKIGTISSAGVITEHPIPTPDSAPTGIITGAYGSVWFTENAANKIGQLDLTTGVITEHPIPTAASHPGAITRDTANGNLLFTETAANQIGQLNPLTGQFTQFAIPTANSGASRGIASGPGGVWFTEGTANKIGRLDPVTGTITEYPIPTANSEPQGITAGLDGGIWFVEGAANKIGRLNPVTGTFTQYPIPTPDSGAGGITVGPDGNVWFAELGANKVGEITAAGTVTEYPISDPSGPMGITTGPAGNVWFTGWGANNIGELTPPPSRTPVRCGGPTFEASGQILTTIKGDLLVNGYCSAGIGARIEGNVRIVRGGSFGPYDGATVDGNVRSNHGFFDARGATVTGNVDVTNVPDGHGIGVIFTDIGGKLIARNIQGGIFFLGFCSPPQFERCTPTGGSRQFHIHGSVTVQNVTGPEPGEPTSTNVFTGYDVGGSVILKNVDGSGTLTNNTVGGDLLCKRVAQLSTWTVSGNTAGGTDTCQPAG